MNSPFHLWLYRAPAGFDAPDNTLLTYNPETNRLYVHLLDYPLGRLLLKGYAGKVKYAQFLHDRSELRVSVKAASVTHKVELDEKDILLVAGCQARC